MNLKFEVWVLECTHDGPDAAKEWARSLAQARGRSVMITANGVEVGRIDPVRKHFSVTVPVGSLLGKSPS